MIYCDNTLLSTLDVSNCISLQWLICSYNSITTLDLSKNTALSTLDCTANQLTNLDVSKNTGLMFLLCGSNPLATLDLSKNLSIGLGEQGGCGGGCYLDISNMPTLGKVCVFRTPFPPNGFLLCNEGSPNAYFSEDCSGI
jgi:hypothetical protein